MSIHIKKHSPAYWQVTLDNPPLNLFDQGISDALVSLIDELENDKEVKVVVFDSADPDYFMAHLDVVTAPQLSLDPGPTGLSPWPDFTVRIERAPFITVGVLRGRARGVGSEFMQAMDIRFASRERAVLCQIEVGTGLIPGGGGLERLPGLVGRARALEIIVSSEDYDADTAALYGWVNRSIPDAELDAFVDRFAKRVSVFSKRAIATAKEIVNKRTGTAKVEDLASTQNVFFGMLASPETQQTLGSLLAAGLQQKGDVEYNLGENLGRIAEQSAG